MPTRSSSVPTSHQHAFPAPRFDRFVHLEPFSGRADENARRFIADVERYTASPEWNDCTRLSFISFLLKDNARLWFDNSYASFTTWRIFIAAFKRAYINEQQIRSKARTELQSRAQLPGETCHEYV